MQNPYLPDGCTQAALDAAHEEPQREEKIAVLRLTRKEWDRLACVLGSYVHSGGSYHRNLALELIETILTVLEES